MDANTTVPADLAAVSLLDIRGVANAAALSESTLRRLISNGKFPQPIRPVGRAPRWRTDVVAAWLRAQGS